MQYPNPAKIMFHLHDRVAWNPYLYMGGVQPISKQIPWKDSVGVFYTFIGMGPPLREVEVKAVTDDILKATEFGVTAARSGQNLPTIWKKPVNFFSFYKKLSFNIEKV